MLYALFLTFLVSALMLDWRSSRRLSPSGRERRRAHGLRPWPGFGRREDFTALGWRQRLAMAACQLAALACLVAWGVTQAAP